MTYQLPGFAQDASVEYSAQLFRRYVIGLQFDEGVMSLADLVVTQRAAGANFQVEVSTGTAVIDGDDEALQGPYVVDNTATKAVTVTAAPGSNSRYDLIVAAVRDPQAGGPSGFDWYIYAVEGTVAASPVVPAVPDSAIPLAVVGPITSSTVAITDSIIDRSVCPLAGRKDEPATFKWRADGKVPTGWLACQGQELLIADYPRLFAHLGTVYGGNGTTTFGLPDGRGRVMVAPNPAESAMVSAGKIGGSYKVTLSQYELPAHSHTAAAHTHPMGHTHLVAPHTHPIVHTHSIAHQHAVATTSSPSHNHTVTGLYVSQNGTGNLGLQAGGYGAPLNLWSVVVNAQSHSHTVTVPAFTGNSGGASVNDSQPSAATVATLDSSSASTGSSLGLSTSATGGGLAHSNVQPFLTVGALVVRT